MNGLLFMCASFWMAIMAKIIMFRKLECFYKFSWSFWNVQVCQNLIGLYHSSNDILWLKSSKKKQYIYRNSFWLTSAISLLVKLYILHNTYCWCERFLTKKNQWIRGMASNCYVTQIELYLHEFHETGHSVTSHCTGQFTPKMKETRNRVCFHLWCELTLALWCCSIVWSLFSWNKM